MSYRLVLLAGWLWLALLPPALAFPDGTRIRVGVFDNPPIVAIASEETPEGIAIDVLRAIAAEEHWELQYVADSWDSLLGRLEAGDLDLLVGIAYNAERAERLKFSRESLLGNWGMVYRNRHAKIESLPDLAGHRVALMRSSIHSQALIDLAEQFHATFTPVYVETYADVLDAVAQGRADAGAVNRVFAAVHAQRPELVVTGIVFNPIFVHYAAPKSAPPEVLDALDRKLAALKSDPGSLYYASLHRWLEARPTTRLPLWLPWIAGAAGALLVMTLGAAGLLRYQVKRQTSELQRRADLLQTEVEQRERAQEHLNQLAYFDGLTRLPNREGFRSMLDQALELARAHNGRLAVLFIDIDRLKNINDGLGHGAGDLLLQQIATRMQSVLRGNDHLSRFGGDEFVVIVSGIEAAPDVELVATRLLESLVAPIALGATQIYSSASIGIALFPDDADSVETLLKHADTAMYQAKEQGGNRLLFYHKKQTASVVERLTLDTRLRQALERNELVLHFQPVVRMRDRRVVGVEALVRWNDPERGLVMPGAFIAAAEETGLIVPLGEWVLEAGCAQLRAWQLAGKAQGMTLAVNVSTRQFQGHRLVDSVEKALARTGLAAEWLELEITEHVMLVMSDDVRSCLNRLRAMGVRLSLDDFGTGYSSLNYLKELPFQLLKVDQSFVSKLPGSPGDRQLVTTIIALAKGLELEVIAEGVETQAQYDLLDEYGCEFAQGYLMSRPQPAESLLELLETQNLG